MKGARAAAWCPVHARSLVRPYGGVDGVDTVDCSVDHARNGRLADCSTTAAMELKLADLATKAFSLG